MRIVLVLFFQFILFFSTLGQSFMHTILPPAGSFYGEVLDDDSIPLAFASVKLYKEGKEFAETLSDFDGRFKFESILAGEYLVEISPPFNCAGIVISKTIFIPINEVVTDTFIFGEPASISGIVINNDGEIIPFANVTLLQNESQIMGTTANFDGQYVLENIEPGIYSIKTSFVGYQTTTKVGIQLYAHKKILMNIKISRGIELPLICNGYTIPIVHIDETTSGCTFTREEIQRMANF